MYRKIRLLNFAIVALLAALSLPAQTPEEQYVKLRSDTPQTITGAPLNIVAAPNNPPSDCDLCVSSLWSPGHKGGTNFQIETTSSAPNDFGWHFFLNEWDATDGTTLDNFYPLYFSTEANGSASWLGTYVGAQFDSGNGGAGQPVYGNWEGLHVEMVNVKTGGVGVTVPGHIYGINIEMPGVTGGATSAGVNVNGLADSTKLAFYTPRGSFRTENGDIVAQSGTVRGKTLRLSEGPTWTAGQGAPTGSCDNGSLYSNTSGLAGSTFYFCIGGHWQAKF